MWGTGLAAYAVAVLHRTSLGVAGLDAADRFGASATVLAQFAVLQLAVYAALQVPAGVLLDRVGARVLVAGGALVMAGGQLVMAVSTGVAGALAGRVLVGAGDAVTFISVLRLVPAWFAPRRVPLVTQLTGILGQSGQVLSAVPFLAVLHAAGWTRAFAGAAAVGVVAAAAALVVVRDAPRGAAPPRGAPGWAEVRARLAASWRHPGTRMGLWTHFVTQFPGTTFALLWGVPFLVSGQGMAPSAAGGLLVVFVVAGVVAGPVVAELVARHPLRRSWLVLAVVGVNAGAWTAVLAWPGRAPTWVLVGLVLALAVGGPGSMVGFDYARTSNPAHRLGTATGIVNVGGFVASLVTILAVGLVLDARTADGAAYSLDAFRWAFAVQVPVWAVGVAGLLATRAQARRWLAAEGVVLPRVRDVLARRRAARRRARGTATGG